MNLALAAGHAAHHGSLTRYHWRVERITPVVSDVESVVTEGCDSFATTGVSSDWITSSSFGVSATVCDAFSVSIASAIDVSAVVFSRRMPIVSSCFVTTTSPDVRSRVLSSRTSALSTAEQPASASRSSQCFISVDPFEFEPRCTLAASCWACLTGQRMLCFAIVASA